MEGKLEWKRRRGRRSTQLLDDLKEKRRHWNLKEEARDRTVWRTCFGRDYNPVATQATQWMNGHCLNRLSQFIEHCLNRLSQFIEHCLNRLSQFFEHCLNRLSQFIEHCLNRLSQLIEHCLNRLSQFIEHCLNRLSQFIEHCLNRLSHFTEHCLNQMSQVIAVTLHFSNVTFPLCQPTHRSPLSSQCTFLSVFYIQNSACISIFLWPYICPIWFIFRQYCFNMYDC